MAKKEVTFSLKDQLFNKEKVEYLSILIKDTYPDFLSEEFEKEVLSKFPELELKERMNYISDLFTKYLFEDFEKSVDILIRSLPEIKENWNMDNNFWEFIFSPYSEFIAKHWCNEKYLEFSLNSLKSFTPYFSAEFAIRHFYNKFEKETHLWMKNMSMSENYHHRRLASEGSRVKLPWAIKINLDYSKTIEILDNLYFDKSRYVTRSVANHLNDISKLNTNLVIETLIKWKKRNNSEDIEYIISHSTRNLVKKWDKKTLELLWYSTNPKIEIKNLNIEKNKIKIWEKLEFNFEILFKKTENLIIDYKIYFPLKNWKLSEKVFKIKKVNNLLINNNDSLEISKNHPFKLMTTKSLFLGNYVLEIWINWKSFGKKEFELI